MHNQRIRWASGRIPGMDVIWYTPYDALGASRIPAIAKHTTSLKDCRNVDLVRHAIHRCYTVQERDLL